MKSNALTASDPANGTILAAEAEYLKSLGERVREARARRGMTRKILAKDSEVSERYLAQLEGGEGNISILLLRQIAQALDLRLETLIMEGPEPPVELLHTTELLAAPQPRRNSARASNFAAGIQRRCERGRCERAALAHRADRAARRGQIDAGREVGGAAERSVY